MPACIYKYVITYYLHVCSCPYKYMYVVSCTTLYSLVLNKLQSHLAGKRRYVYKKPLGHSFLAEVFKIMREAWRLKKRRQQAAQNRRLIKIFMLSELDCLLYEML